MNWEDAYDLRPSKNVRGENVYDIYRKGTENMLWADIPVDQIEDFLKVMVDFANRVITQQMDDIFSENPDE